MLEIRGLGTNAISIQWSRRTAEELTYGRGPNGEASDLVIFGGDLWVGTRRWQLTDTNLPTLKDVAKFEPPALADMSQPEALADFVKYALPTNGTSQDFLVLFGHGGPPQTGLWTVILKLPELHLLALPELRLLAKKTQKLDIMRAIHAPMTLLQVGKGLRSAISSRGGSKLEALVSCQCLMATIESLYEFRSVCKFFLTSEPVLSIPTWPHFKRCIEKVRESLWKFS
jgi:hypothetical protein